MSPNAEKFRPVSNTPPTGIRGKLKFWGRMVLDLQILTIYKDIKHEIPHYRGKVLDVGCGQSPYRYLLNQTVAVYFGIDIADAYKFDYQNPDVTPFNGEEIPFGTETFDHLICTEVLEHVYNHQKLTDEMYRVMKTGATGIITIPWSARYHYIPWDYFRYTPSALKNIFSKFSSVTIKPRGNDLAAIANKTIVLFFRNLLPYQKWRFVFIPAWICFLPVLAFVVLVAHLAILFHLGTDEDPLGYTIWVKK